MAKKQNQRYTPKRKETTIEAKPLADLQSKKWYEETRNHLWFLFLLSVGLYANSIFNEYALDDMIVITHNSFTQKGFAGIHNILFKDSFVGFTGMENQLAGGRYRPLSIVTFAVEYGLLGLAPHFSHFINVILYGLLNCILFLFLKDFVFKKWFPSMVAVILFAVHPIHTEIVANIKSRDELLSMGFLFVSMYLMFSHLLRQKNRKYFIISLVCYFLSLLSKENGLAYLAIIPLFLYFFNGKKLKDSIINVLPYVGVLFIYLVIRIKLTGFKMVENNEILNSPFIYATKTEGFATKVMLLGKYLLMLVFPHPLSYDYSYNQIRYVGLNNIQFLVSLLLNGALIVYALLTFGKRNILSFCVFFYFANMSLVTNFVFDVGTPFADRFLFQSSLAIAIAVAYFINKMKENGSGSFKPVTIMLVIVCGVASARTIVRNTDWKNENQLFLHDVNVCPNSAKTNSNCGVALINTAGELKDSLERVKLYNEAIVKLQKAVKIHPRYVDAYLNLGVGYSRLHDVPNTEASWLKAREISPAHPRVKELLGVLSDLYILQGYQFNQRQDYAGAVNCYNKAIEYNGKNVVDAWYNIGGNYLMLKNVEKAKEAWIKTLEINPNHAEAKKWLAIISKPPEKSKEAK